MARGRKAKTVKVDFQGVESNGIPEEGRQLATVADCTLEVSDNSGAQYLNWRFKCAGGTAWHTASLQPQALWNLRNILEALGLEIPDGEIDIDPAEFVDMQIGLDIEHEVYQRKPKAVVVDVFKAPEITGEEDSKGTPESDELPTLAEVNEMDKEELKELADEFDVNIKGMRSESKIRDKIIDELELDEDDGNDGDDLDEMDKDELKAFAKKNGIDIKGLRSESKIRSAIEEALEEEQEEEKEEEKPARRSSRRTSAKKLEVGSKVTLEDDGETLKGKVLEIDGKGFAVVEVEVDDEIEEWEVEVEDLTLV